MNRVSWCLCLVAGVALAACGGGDSAGRRDAVQADRGPADLAPYDGTGEAGEETADVAGPRDLPAGDVAVDDGPATDVGTDGGADTVADRSETGPGDTVEAEVATTCQTTADCPAADVCNVATCTGGKCSYAAPDCDDGLPCTIDSCDPGSGGCYHAWDASTACTPCVRPTDCPTATNAFVACVPCPGEGPTLNHFVCPDSGNVCASTPCKGVVDDGDPCTTDSCDADGTVHHVPIAACCHADAECDGGSRCNPVSHACVVVPAKCPLPVIGMTQDQSQCAESIVHLSGDQSLAGVGAIVSWAWTVTQPTGSTTQLAPGADAKDPTHEELEAGDYTYCLDVCDGSACSGDAACKTTACTTLTFVPCTTGFHVELEWPGLPGAPADLDLHVLLLDEGATGAYPWFDATADCFWGNPSPAWGGTGRLLDADATGGGGPENIVVNAPEPGRTYVVGVHVWNLNGQSTATPKVNIYENGTRVFESTLTNPSPPLSTCDLWEVATVFWPTGTPVSLSDPTALILPSITVPASVGATCGQAKPAAP